MMRRKQEKYTEGGESRDEQQVILMKIGELRFSKRFFLLSFSPSMPSPHKSDLIKKVLVLFFVFLINARS